MFKMLINSVSRIFFNSINTSDMWQQEMQF